jgi:hypothetical protein
MGEVYTGFEAAHIFPLSEADIVSFFFQLYSCRFHLNHLEWNDLNYKRFVEDDQIAPGFELNSIQQGFLCSSEVHKMFDDYSIGVNPDVRPYILTWDIRHDNSSAGQLPYL